MRRPVGTGREVAFFSRYALPFVSSGGVSRGAAGFSVVGAVARACSRASSRPRSSASSRCNALSSAGADFGCAGAAAGFDSGLLSGNGFGAAAAGTVGFEGTSRSSLSEPAGGGAPCARTCGDHASVANTVSERKRMDLNTSEFQGEKSTTGQLDGRARISGLFGRHGRSKVECVRRIEERMRRDARGNHAIAPTRSKAQPPGNGGSAAAAPRRFVLSKGVFCELDG